MDCDVVVVIGYVDFDDVGGDDGFGGYLLVLCVYGFLIVDVSFVMGGDVFYGGCLGYVLKDGGVVCICLEGIVVGVLVLVKVVLIENWWFFVI